MPSEGVGKFSVFGFRFSVGRAAVGSPRVILLVARAFQPEHEYSAILTV